jgi:serine/threonine protein kinase
MTLTQCPKCGTLLAEGASACANCGWMPTGPTRDAGAARASSDLGLRHSGETLLIEARDLLFERLKTELAGAYELEKELGRGGMAVVYQAVETDLHRTVALKVLPPGTGGPTLAERFKREARMAAALDHPNIIPVYRVGQAAGTYFFAMKYVEGRAVDAIVESQGALPIPVILQILRASASALAFAHDRGIVHRDIKGANILVDRDGRVMVSDFGIARAAEEKTLTASGSVIGTPHFMSPEQCSGAKAAPQSDQYSLGVLAFQMLTGSVPFDAEALMGILQHHFFTPVPDISAVRQGVPPLLLTIVYRALAKDPLLRYGSTHEMLEALEQVPFGDAARREAEALLRQLAIGAPVPKVRTGSLPPLGDTRLSGAARGSAASQAPTLVGGAKPGDRTAASPPRRRLAPLVAGAVVVLAGAGISGKMMLDRQAARAQAAADSTARADTLRDFTRRATVALAIQRRADSVRVADSAAAVAAARPPDAQKAPATRRRPADRVAPPPAPVGDPGLLRVSTDPANAQIYVDGRLVGEGGVVDEPIAAGRRIIRIQASGYVVWSRAVTVESGQPVRLGRVTLVAQP